jgi:dienelactone hydrolase
MRRLAIGLIGLVLLVPLLPVLALAVVTPLSRSGAVYLFAALLMAGGLIAVLRWGRPALWVALAGLLLALGLAGARVARAAQAARREAPLRVVVLPNGATTRWVDALVDEQDLLLFGEALMRLLGGVSRREHAGLVPALTAGYADLRMAQGSLASPVPSTYLFWQRPRAFDAVVVEPEGERPPRAAVVFLHGFMGNVALQCWEIARAARPQGLLTVCPSVGWIGDWWLPQGRSTLQATLDYARAQGAQQIYVGGFSNGGAGLSQMAASLTDEPNVAGLFFIAGVSHGQDLAATSLPVLIIQGTQDERMHAPAAQQAAAAIGAAATYVELDADHFLIVKQAEAVRAALAGWLAALTQ